ncbi:MAG TPA: DUF1254 domain-containing protein [Rhizomicrobium sp.]|nr:DUF1254 domain-containing protein [Rhizomicrobium sp.]
MSDAVQANPSNKLSVPVTADNFMRAESDKAFDGIVKQGGFGKFFHARELQSLDKQVVPRINRDTLYSIAILDLDAGPATVTLPDPGTRFLSMQVLDEDEYNVKVAYGAGRHTFDKDAVGTRYIMVAVRILVDPASKDDIAKVHALQDAIRIEQKDAGRFEVPNWEPESQKKVREALLVLGETVPDSKKMFGARGEVDPVRHLIGIAGLWGGNTEKDAIYLTIVPSRNDGETVHRLTVKDVPVDGFWSITVYNAKGYLEPNSANAYSLNNITAKKDADGGVSVQFGGCGGKTANCLPIMPGWNYTVRLYRPRAEILDGSWKFPAAQPVR